MRPRPSIAFCLFALLATPSSAWAGGRFADEAKSRMKLDFDLEEVEERLAEPAAAAMAPPGTPNPVRTLPLEPNSEAASVTVFADRAVVTRVLGERLDVGLATLSFEGLPFVLAAGSLNAGILDGSARIVGVELVSAAADIEEGSRTEALREQAKQITSDLGQVRDRLEALLAQREYLRSTLLSAPVSGQSRADLADVKATMTYLGEAERDIARELRVEEERAQELGEELSPKLIKLDNPQATGQTVRVELDVERAGELRVALRYQVWGASWTPSYNARLADDRMEFEYQGVVTQHTGEDWDDVELLLSTANPSVSGSMPDLSPWYLGRGGFGQQVQSSLQAGRGLYEEAGEERPRSGGGGVIESKMEAAVQAGGAVVFAVPGRRSIAGDGSAQRIPVGTQTFATDVELAAVPKLVPEVFRRARVSYDGEVPLLPGPVATYVDGDYVGSSSIAAVVPGETFELAFGADERLRVERQMLTRRQEFIGPAKKTVRYTFHFRIRVANFSGRERVVEIADQLPVSELDRVTVKAVALDEGAEQTDDDNGILQWQLAVADGAEETVDFEFTVTAPVDTPELYEMDLMF